MKTQDIIKTEESEPNIRQQVHDEFKDDIHEACKDKLAEERPVAAKSNKRGGRSKAANQSDTKQNTRPTGFISKRQFPSLDNSTVKEIGERAKAIAMWIVSDPSFASRQGWCMSMSDGEALVFVAVEKDPCRRLHGPGDPIHRAMKILAEAWPSTSAGRPSRP